MESWTRRDSHSSAVDSDPDLVSGDLESDLIDLAGCSLADLRVQDDEALASSLDQLLQQVDRPRGNFGGSDPPGRAD
jgi:hypothetical protein